MTRVQLIDVTKRFGSTPAVDNVSADIADGEFVTLLGPSGCGKTTTLRFVAGLVDPASGQIKFDGQVINNVPPHKRNIGLAFQSHALFPHLRVARNIAFGLDVKGSPKAEIQQRVREMLGMIELSQYADRMPAQLDIYLRPRTEFVAGFVGDNNAIPGEVVGLVDAESGEPRLVDVRAGAMRLRG